MHHSQGDIDQGAGYVQGQGAKEILLSSQFCYELKTTV